MPSPVFGRPIYIGRDFILVRMMVNREVFFFST